MAARVSAAPTARAGAKPVRGRCAVETARDGSVECSRSGAVAWLRANDAGVGCAGGASSRRPALGVETASGRRWHVFECMVWPAQGAADAGRGAYGHEGGFGPSGAWSADFGPTARTCNCILASMCNNQSTQQIPNSKCARAPQSSARRNHT